ncbi:hypothetical protein DYB37_007907 [Aphanomyces astaci]|uniref:Peptidase A1 domain-containing protein n=1 Tax=Aphanomyces astaci TaxID=112090 RepID=A0A3R6XH08_APHAT|nr:hypothetical protein DYB37_007907 [Aphanomyces astaci]
MRILALSVVASFAKAAFNASALPPVPRKFPTYTYPDDLNLAHSFPVTVKKGRDLLLPLAPLKHALFPEVDPVGSFSLGVSLSACAGSMYVSLVTTDNVVFPLSTAALQCFTFAKETPSTTNATNLCPVFYGPDDLYYTIDPYKIQGVLLMADVDMDLQVAVSFASSLTFPHGYPRMFSADSLPNMTLDATSSAVTFELPTTVDVTSFVASTCHDCIYTVFLSPVVAHAAAAPVLPPICLVASSIARLPLDRSGASSGGHIPRLHTSVAKGDYIVYVVASVPPAADATTRPAALFLYTPVTAYIAHSVSWTYVLVVAVAVAAGAATGLVLLRHFHRKKKDDRRHAPSRFPVPIASGETAGLLPKPSATFAEDDESYDDDLDGYHDIDHVTV